MRRVENSLQSEGQENNTSCTQSIANCCDPAFVRSVFSLHEVLFPWSWRKPVWWLVTATLLGGAIAIELTTHAFSIAANYDSLTLMVFIYAIDPVLQLMSIMAAQYPPLLAVKENHLPTFEENFSDSVFIDIEHLNPDIAIVIPAHRAANKIETTISSCLKHVGPQQIFIIDNGNSEYPLDDTKEIVKRVNPRINYIWGHIGNKTFAQYLGTLYAAGYRYIFTMDDDMRLPPNFAFGAGLINQQVKAVCYSIVAVHPVSGKSNLLIEWQSLEYKMADCAKLAQARAGSALYPHGAASMWERETFLEVLKLHNAVFFAEDVQLGMLLERQGYQMKMASGSNLATEAPTSLFGTSPNFYQQRVRSWEMGRQVYFLKFLWQFLSVAPPSDALIGSIMLKLYEAYAVYSNCVDWTRLPLFAILLLDEDYWIRLAIITAASIVPLLIWNYIKLPLNQRTDLQSSFIEILTFPLFKLLESAMSVGAIIRLLWVFGPNYTRKANVNEMAHQIINDPLALRAEVRELACNSQHADLITYKKVFCDFLFPLVEDPDDVSNEEVLDSVQSVVETLEENSETEVNDIALEPIDTADEEYYSANTSSDSFVLEEGSEEIVDTPTFFSAPLSTPRKPKANRGREAWLGNLNRVVSPDEDEISPTDERRHHFFSRPNTRNVTAHVALGNWLGSLRRNIQ